MRPHLATFVLAAVACSGAAPDIKTPAQLRIAAAQQVLVANPRSAPAYLELATGYVRLARENDDVRLLDQADQTLLKSPQDLSGNYDAQKLRVAIALGRHDYAGALTLATALNRRAPDDIPVWGFLVQANMALGNYSEAEKQAQWMLDLLPGNGPGLGQAAELREVYGDLEGAIEFSTEAYRRVSENDSEERASLLTENAHRQLIAGNLAGARENLDRALKLLPEYPPALLNLARLRTAERNYPEAADLLARRNQHMQSTGSLYGWA